MRGAQDGPGKHTRIKYLRCADEHREGRINRKPHLPENTAVYVVPSSLFSGLFKHIEIISYIKFHVPRANFKN